MAIARIERLTYWYGNSGAPALRNVNVAVPDGLTLVAGPSGGGKSTILRLLNGLVPHFHGGQIAGSVRTAGWNVIVTPTRRLARTVGFVFQDPELQSVYDTVEREVAFGLENLGVPSQAMGRLVHDALAEVGIEHLAGRRIWTLSGGERQRVALASVLAMQPRVVVMDEPTSQLDPDGAALLLAAATRLVDTGRAVVISEHRVETLAGVAGAVIEVEAGRATTHAARDWNPPRPPRVSNPRAASPGAAAWTLEQVTAGFRDHPVVAGVDLEGRYGEVVALSGPNGGGKTTLLRTIAGSLPPLQGKIDRAPGRVAYLPQNPAALLHRPTVRAEVEFTLSRSKEGGDAREVLAAMGLEAVAGRYPRDLSTGERQRAALAAVLPGRPRCVLLDEPTRGMDLAAREALMRLVAALRDSGSSVVLATHDAALRDALADRVVEVCGGRVIEKSEARA